MAGEDSLLFDVLVCGEVSQDMLSVRGKEWQPPWCFIGRAAT